MRRSWGKAPQKRPDPHQNQLGKRHFVPLHEGDSYAQPIFRTGSVLLPLPAYWPSPRHVSAGMGGALAQSAADDDEDVPLDTKVLRDVS